MKRIIFCLILFISVAVKAQEITVLDSETNTPIFNVTVTSEENREYKVSNIDGVINISLFGGDEELVFQHVSYSTKKLTKNQILQENNIVFLDPNSEQLDEIVLSATKWKQDKKEVYQKVTSITREDIIFSNPQTSADMLQQTGQVFIQKSQYGGGSPMIRGFATNRLLISVDGIRMNNAIFRGGNIQNVISVDPLAIERTEVVFGPGALIYGSDAIGGALNFYTIDPAFSKNKELNISGKALARYATASNEKTGNVQLNLGLEKWAFLTNVSFSNFGDLKMGKNGPDEYLRKEYVVTQNNEDIMVSNNDPLVQNPSGYTQFNILQKIKYKPNDVWDYTGSLYYSATSDYSRYDRLIRYRGDNLRSAEWFYGPQKWFMGNLQITKQSKGKFFDQFRITSAYQHFEESRNDRDFNDDILYNTSEKVRAFSSNLDFEKRISKKSDLFYGIEYVYNHVNSKGNQTNIYTLEQEKTASRYPDGSSWQSLAAYLNLKTNLSKKLTLTSGLRYSLFFIDAVFSENNEFYNLPFEKARLRTGAFTGSTGLNWQPSNVLEWRLNISTAFRAPNIDDIGKIFDSEPGKVVVPNPRLDPEYAYNGEIGVKLNFEENIILNFAAFYTHLTNSMVRRPFSFSGMDQIMYNGELSEVQSIQNAAQSKVYGFEASAKVKLSSYLSLKSHISYVNGEEELDNGQASPLRHAPPIFGSTHIFWKKKKLTLDFFADYNGELSFYDLAPSEVEKDYLYAIDENGNPYSPSWYTLNIKSKYDFSEKIQVMLALENITNQRYKTYSSGIVAPGINFISSLIYNLN